MRWQAVHESSCSIARALAVLGERWTLLILREVFQGRTRFDALRASLGIARNVLSARLDHLVTQGVLEKVSYQDRPPRHEYRLTEKGRDLYPVLLALMAWGDRWLAPVEGPPLRLVHRGCGREVAPRLACPACGEALTPESTRARLRAPLLAESARS